MGLNKLMDLAAKHHQDQAFDKLLLETMLEVLVLTVSRNILPEQRDSELTKAMDNIINRISENCEGADEAEVELLGTVKSVIIDVLDKADYRE